MPHYKYTTRATSETFLHCRKSKGCFNLPAQIFASSLGAHLNISTPPLITSLQIYVRVAAVEIGIIDVRVRAHYASLLHFTPHIIGGITARRVTSSEASAHARYFMYSKGAAVVILLRRARQYFCNREKS